jgi:hypothetical protein
MSIFGSIMSKIFGSRDAAAQPAAQPAPDAGQAAPAPPAAGAGQQSAAPTTAAPAGAAQQPVDVAAVLTDLASKNPEKLNWRQSIVDLMKLLNLDSSLAARKQLAQELHYTGDMNDSAAMNMWLHKQVMQKLAENGGKVPDDLRT